MHRGLACPKQTEAKKQQQQTCTDTQTQRHTHRPIWRLVYAANANRSGGSCTPFDSASKFEGLAFVAPASDSCRADEW